MSGRSSRTVPQDQAALFQHLGLLRADLHARELREELGSAPIGDALAYSQLLGRIDQLRDDRILRLCDALSGVPKDEAKGLTLELTRAATAHPLRDDPHRDALPRTWRSAFYAISGRPALAILTIGESSVDDDAHAEALRSDLLIECALRAVQAKDPKLALLYADRAEASLSRFPEREWPFPLDLSVNLQEARALAYLARKEVGDEERASQLLLQTCQQRNFDCASLPLQLRLRRAVGRCLLEIPDILRSHQSSRVWATRCVKLWTALIYETESCTEDLVCASRAHSNLADSLEDARNERPRDLALRRQYDLACTLAEKAFRAAPASLHAAQRFVSALTERVRVRLDATSDDAHVDRVREIWNTCVSYTGAQDAARVELASDQREPYYFAWQLVRMRSRLDRICDHLGSTLRICAEVQSRHPQYERAHRIRLSVLYVLSKVHDHLPGSRARLLASRYRKAAVRIAERWVNRHPEQRDSFERLIQAYADQAKPDETTGSPSSDPEAGRAADLARSGRRHIETSSSESELPTIWRGDHLPPRECLARCRRMVADRPQDYHVLVHLESLLYRWHKPRNRGVAKRSSHHHRRIHQLLLELHRTARTAYASEWHGSPETTQVLADSLWRACHATHASDDLSLRLRFVADLEHVLLLESRIAMRAAASGEDIVSRIDTILLFPEQLFQFDSQSHRPRAFRGGSLRTAQRIHMWIALLTEALSQHEATMAFLKTLLHCSAYSEITAQAPSPILDACLRILQHHAQTASGRPRSSDFADEAPDFMRLVALHCAANRSRCYAQTLQVVIWGILAQSVDDRTKPRPPDSLTTVALSSLRILMEAGALNLKSTDFLLPIAQSLASDDGRSSEVRIAATKVVGGLIPLLEPIQATEVKAWMIHALEQTYAGEAPASEPTSWQSPIRRQCNHDRQFIQEERKYRLPDFESRVSSIRQRRIENLERELENIIDEPESENKERRAEDLRLWLGIFLGELADELREAGTPQGHASALSLEKRRLSVLESTAEDKPYLLDRKAREYQNCVRNILVGLHQTAVPLRSSEVYAYACKGAAVLNRLRRSHPSRFRQMMADLLLFHWMAADSAFLAGRPDAPRRIEMLREACRIAACDATFQEERSNAQKCTDSVEAWILEVTGPNSEEA